MPYKRSYRRRPYKRTYKRKRYSTGERNIVGLARSAYRGVKYLKGLVNSELYKNDVQTTGTMITTPLVQHATAITQGDGDNGRTGNSLLAKSLRIAGSITAQEAGYLNFIVVKVNQQVSDTAPAYTDVYESTSVGSALNSDNVGKFTILHKKVFKFSDASTWSQTLDVNIPLNFHVRYNGTASTDINRNGIYWMMVSTSAVSGPVIVIDRRLSYHDN